jgi:hypothetical protein
MLIELCPSSLEISVTVRPALQAGGVQVRQASGCTRVARSVLSVRWWSRFLTYWSLSGPTCRG